MDNIIEFRASQAPSRHGKPVFLDGAQVLMFTGVRYDRSTDDTDRVAFGGSSLGEQRLMTQEESEMALDLAAY